MHLTNTINFLKSYQILNQHLFPTLVSNIEHNIIADRAKNYLDILFRLKTFSEL